MSVALQTIGNTALQRQDEALSETDLRALDFADLGAVVRSQHVDLYSDLSGAERDVVFAKVEWLKAVWRELEAIQRDGRGGLEDAITATLLRHPEAGAELATAGKNGSDARTIHNARNWTRKKLGMKRGVPDWSNWKALAPQWRPKEASQIDADFRAIVMKLYLHPNMLPLKACHQKAVRVWRLQQGDEAAIPSYDQVRRYAARIAPQVIDKYRGGREVYANRRKGYVPRDTADIAPGEVWFSDHRIMDLFCRIPHPEDPEQWVATRPYITAIQDARSGYIVAAKIYAAGNPNHERILETMQDAIIAAGMVPPKVWYTDNGRDFKKAGVSEAVTLKSADGEVLCDGKNKPYRYSVLQALRTRHKLARGYNGKEKPVERGFGSVAGGFDKTQPGYTGSDTKRRPDLRDTWQGDVMRLPSLAQVVAAFEDWLANEHHAREREDGKTIQEMWDAREACEERTLDARRLFLSLLMPHAQARKVSRTGVGSCGVRFGGWMYSHIDLRKHADKWVMIKTYWGMPLVSRQGNEVPAAVFVFAPDDTFIAAAPAEHCAQMVADTDEEREKIGRMQHLINYVGSLDTDEFAEHTGSRQLTSPAKVLQLLPGHGESLQGSATAAISAGRTTRRLAAPGGRDAGEPRPPRLTAAAAADLADFQAAIMDAAAPEADESIDASAFSAADFAPDNEEADTWRPVSA